VNLRVSMVQFRPDTGESARFDGSISARYW
jgi:hypothetical protein